MDQEDGDEPTEIETPTVLRGILAGKTDDEGRTATGRLRGSRERDLTRTKALRHHGNESEDE